MKKLTALLLALGVLLSVCGCGAKQEPKPVETTAATENVEATEETKVVRTDLNIFSDLEPETLETNVTIPTAILFRNLYTNLYRINSNNQIVPELAESYTANEDFTVHTFTLKENAFFSDGTPITAEDVRFTYQRGMDAGIDFYNVFKSVEAPDDRTVIITLLEPNNCFLSDMTAEHMSVMSKAAVEGGMDVANCPNITSGAYYVDHWDKENHQIHLKSNPYFLEGEPAIKDVTIFFKLDKPYQAMLDGTIDYITNIANDSKDMPYLRAADNVDLFSYDDNSWVFLALNQLQPHYADDNVRRAIACALDLDYIISTALGGQGTPAPLIITSAVKGYLPGFNNSPYDVKKAREYMAASAYPDGFTMTLEIPDNSGSAVAEAIKTLLKEINIDVEIVSEDGNLLLDNALSFQYDATFLLYSMYSGSISHAIPLFSDGYLHLSQGDDTEIGALLQRSLGVDEDERDELLTEAYTMMRDKWPYIGLFWSTVYDAKVQSLKLTEPVTSEKYILSNMYWE